MKKKYKSIDFQNENAIKTRLFIIKIYSYMKKIIIFILGAPCSGKSTLRRALKQKISAEKNLLKIEDFSVGNLLRQEVKKTDGNRETNRVSYTKRFADTQYLLDPSATRKVQ